MLQQSRKYWCAVLLVILRPGKGIHLDGIIAGKFGFGEQGDFGFGE